jgi:hypothetical protein
MRNINELIGIIKGINFDGVINDKEIEKLKSWTDKNRNLAYDSEQAELIKLLDDILEDNVVDDDERMAMLEYCKRFQNKKDDISKMYELNGLIEGIICDGEVNEPEVYRLKEWIDDNKDFVRQHGFAGSLSVMLDDILADGVVSMEEQEQLLLFLGERIYKNRLETKIEFLKSQVRARKNIGADLIDLLDKEDAIEVIHNKAGRQLISTLNTYTGCIVRDSEIVFISLVLIAMLYYDGNYYDNVRKIYKKVYKEFSAPKVEGLIRSVLYKYQSDLVERNSKVRIINVALSNAIVPSYFLSSFFEFIYDIYKLNFEYELTSDLDEEFKFVYKGLRENMLSEDDNVKLNVTKKTYKLIKTTKQLIVDENTVDAVIKLSIIVIKIIDKEIWGRELKIFNPYLKVGYAGWIKNLNQEIKFNKDSGKIGVRKHRKPRLALSDNVVYIKPTAHRISNQYDYRDIKVVVDNGYRTLYENKTPDIKEIIGGYQLSVGKIILSEPLGTLRYYVMAGSKIIYDSKNELHRKFIVFDVDGNEIKNNTDYSGTAIFCLREKGQFRTYYNDKCYSLASENVKLGASYLIESEVFNFSSFVKPGIFGTKLENHYLEGDNKKIQVYSELKYLMFENDNRGNDFEIIINGKTTNIFEYQCIITKREGVNKYIVELPIEKSGIYKIDVNNNSDRYRKQILSETVALDKELSNKLEVVGDGVYYVEIKSGLFDEVLSTEIRVDDFQLDWLKFKQKGKNYSYLIPFEFEFYRLNNGNWKHFTEELWIGDIAQGSVLDIYGDKFDEVLICSNLGVPLGGKIPLKDKGAFRQLAVGFLVSYKETYEYIQLLFLENKRIVRGMFCYNKVVIDEKKTEFAFNPETKCMDFIVAFHGEGNVYMQITNMANEEVYRSGILDDSYINQTTELPTFENLNIHLLEKSKGISLRKERVLKEYQKFFYSHDDLASKTFGLQNAFYRIGEKTDTRSQKVNLAGVYVRFVERIEEDVFIGEIYRKMHKKIYRLQNINPVQIEICGEHSDGNLEIDITKDGDGLLLDIEHSRILDTMNDYDVTDIFSYTMDIGGILH